MAKTKEDYMELGRKHAQAEITDHHYPRYGKSWQSLAYWEGFDAEEQRLQVKEELAHQQFAKLKEDAGVPKEEVHVIGAGASTGRHGRVWDMPNLQNIPLNSPETKRIKSVLAQAGRDSIFEVQPQGFDLTQVDMRYWPEGAKEHARQLHAQLCKERWPYRAARLVRSLQRLQSRHSVQAA